MKPMMVRGIRRPRPRGTAMPLSAVSTLRIAPNRAPVTNGVAELLSATGTERRTPTGGEAGFRSAPSGNPCPSMIDNVGSLFTGIELCDLLVLLSDRGYAACGNLRDSGGPCLDSHQPGISFAPRTTKAGRR